MLTRKMIPSVCAAAMLTALAATPALAQQTLDARTEFTFHQPVELPGVTLPPGTYIFRFADATTGRKVMQVQAKDQSRKTYGMFLTITANRPQPSDEAELRFMETPAGQPAAVKTWWYPGNTIGREFIYPKSQARRLAQATNQPVLTTQAESVTNDEMKTADLSYVSPNGRETPASDDASRAASVPAQQLGVEEPVSRTSGTLAARAGTTPAGVTREVSEARMARTTLPRTSTPLGGIGLLGLAALLGGAVVRLRA